ncbi:DNA-binding protein [Neisseria weaveri]|uniref:Putative phage associated protein n=1 Tax=Neisseria weaveri TaxID=28091 RepID=A0A448VJW0_9NEIS|nr:DNA-binding protein [Neisseria weaveri]VEJ50045.1 putative phage associated protein [Neisseria weaveri]
MSKQINQFSPLPYPQTPKSAQKYFIKRGINKSEWARYFGFERTIVEHLLGGKLKGRRGQAHEAAIKLGLKENPDGER